MNLLRKYPNALAWIITAAVLILGFGGPIVYARISNPPASISTPVSVANGGTGATSLTDHGLIVGGGTGALDALSVGTNGQLLVGSTGADPVFATANCAAGLTCTLGAGTFQIDVDTSQSIATLSNLTTNGVLYTSGGVGTLNIDSGALDFARGGTGGTAFAAGSVIFSNGTVFTEDTVNFTFDDTNNRFAVGSSTPKRSLVASSTASIEQSLADAATITFDLRFYNQARVTITDNRTIDFTNETEAMGQTIRFVVCQDASGSSLLTWDSAVRWVGGTAPTLTTTANKCDVIAGFTTAATGTPIIILDKVLNI